MFSPLKNFKTMNLVKTQMSRCSTLAKYKTLSLTTPKPFVIHVELNRPEKLNAMNKTMWM